jgi:chemotaxis protein MotB
MSRKKKHPEHENHERWLVSYADLLTLLFAFFVVMFASSQSDKGKAKQVSEAVRQAMEEGRISGAIAGLLRSDKGKHGPAAAPAAAPGPANAAGEGANGKAAELLPTLQYLTDELKQEIATGKMQLRLEERGLVVTLRETAFFGSGDADVSADTYPSIEKVAKAINAIPNPVRLEGHTDAVPIHNSRFRSNWELSAARGIAMLELFSARFGTPRERLAIAGYADNLPVDSNQTDDGRARNRRVDVVILSRRGLAGEPQPTAGHAASKHS